MKKFTLLFLLAATLSASALKAQYCMLPGRTSYSPYQPGIKNFKLNTINRTSGNVENPLSSPSVVVTTDTTSLQRGQTYTVTIAHTRDSVNAFFATARNNIRMWIDYNNDKDFDDAGETVISADTITAGVYTASFTVPATAPMGIVRLRVTAKMSKDAGHNIPTPCDMPADPLDYHGEMEDYTLRIMPAAGIENISSDNMQVSVYPNPANDKISVNIDSKDNELLNIGMYDITGKLVSTLLQEAKQTASRYDFHLNNDISNGVYFIRVSSTTGQSYKKLVIAH